MSSLWLNCTLINGPFVALAASDKEYQKVMRSLGLRVDKNEWANQISQCLGKVLELKNEQSKPAFVVLIDPKKHNDFSALSILVHESVHVWQGVCRYIGESSPSVEFEAYSIQNIYEALANAYAKHKKARKR
jgi:hypothetical protein